jgi:putative ABC transport system permease protein
MHNPPRLFLRFFRWFCHPELKATIEGDLIELYNEKLNASTKHKADFRFIIDVLLLFRPGIIRPIGNYQPSNNMAMFRNYFVISWRSMTRQKMYSAIKVGGLAAGIAACLLIALYIQRELSYDKHYAEGDRIYRIVRESTFKGEHGIGVHFPAPLANALQEDYPDFEKVGHYNDGEYFGAGSNELRRAEHPESTHEEGFVFMNQPLLDILELHFIQGSPEHALTEPNTIVITRRKAVKFFPGEDPLGKLIILNNDDSRLFKVTGVIEDFPTRSHLHYDFLMTLAGREFSPGEQTNWRNSNYIDYVRVRPGTNIPAVEAKLAAVLKKYFLPYTLKSGADAEEIGWLNSFSFKLQPVKDIYINREGINDSLEHGDIRYIWLFGSIAGFILLIACINFINLSTAKSANRAKEVGLRKVVGSARGNLIRQFLTESLLYSFFSFALGLALAYLLLPYFNNLIAKSLNFPWKEVWLLPVLVSAAILVGIIAGLYPSVYLSSFKPVHVLKGNVSRGSKNSTTRSLLVVFQFTVSIVLIIGTIVISRQMNYILTKKVGFDKEQMLILQGTHTLGDNIVVFKNELVRLADVNHATISGFLPVSGSKRNNGGMWKEGMPEEDRVSSQHWAVDHDYIKTMGFTIIDGRDFSFEIPSDSQAMIINKSMVTALGLDNPIGEHLFNWKGKWTVIGVVEDFHFESMKQTIQPMAMYIGRSPNTISVKVNTADMASAIQSISKLWKKFSPHQPIRFTFLDQRYARMYDDVKRTGNIFTSFALLAIVVACLGLFALSAFMVEQRGKEISIRLILGASVKSIFKLLTQNFIALVLISFIVAVPIAWYLMQKWLQDYVYKIAIGWEIFALAGALALMVALLTVSYQSLRAAATNPVDNLKSE